MKTTREILACTKITRKALRIYMEKQLILPAGKNEQGGWLFEDSTVKTVEDILYFQSIGFTLNEIRSVRTMEKEALCTAIENKIIELKEKKTVLNQTISMAEQELHRMRGEEHGGSKT